MHRIGFAGLPLWAALALACSGEGALEPSAPSKATALTAVTATTFTGIVGMEMNPAPTVRATDGAGNPVQGVLVAFSMAAKGIVVRSGVVVPTGSDGIATVAWMLREQAGLHTVTAEATGLPPVSFSVTAAPGSPAIMTRVLSAEGQAGPAGTPLELPLSLVLGDRFGNPIAGAAVTFTVLSGGGSIDGAAAITDSSGVATSGRWTLGTTPGQQQVGAQAGDLRVAFTATALMEPCPDCAATAQLAFVRDDDIHVSNISGTAVARLTHNGVNGDPAWSPDGKRIAFSSDRGGRRDIYIMNADGSGLLRRTDIGGYNTDPAWSPDGRSIAFSSLRDGQFGIYVMAVDGDWSNPRHVGPDRGWNAHPAWSPDGGKIAFTSDWRAYDIVYDLYTMNADGSNVTAIAEGPFFTIDGHIFYYQSAWSPDGKTIAVVACPDTAYCYSSNITLVNADGSELRVLAQAGGYASPTWSPDGTKIAFSSSACGGCASSIRYVRADGSGEGLLIANAHSPAWRP
ncbi:MAG: hypothetical protein ACSLFE_06280 [Gemmatimonadaceae bacterium]